MESRHAHDTQAVEWSTAAGIARDVLVRRPKQDDPSADQAGVAPGPLRKVHPKACLSKGIAMQITNHHQRAMQYIENAGGTPQLDWFYDDHEPIGESLRNELEQRGLVNVWMDDDGHSRIELTDAGRSALGAYRKTSAARSSRC